MNETYGPFYAVSRAEAATPEMADERARVLKNQFIMDMHTRFLRDDTPIKTFIAQRATVGKLGWNPAIEQKFPHLLEYSDVRDVGKAAKDWPQLNFVIYHSGWRWTGPGAPKSAWEHFEKLGTDRSNLAYGYVAKRA